MVEVGLFRHLAGDPGSLLAGPEDLLPGAPLEPRREGGSGAACQQDGGAGPAGLVARHEERHRGEDGVRLGDRPLGGDRRVPGPPGVVLGGGEGVRRRVRPVSARLELGQDTCGEPVAGARRGEQAAQEQLTQCGIGMGVPHERRQVRLVRQLAAERDGEAQGVTGGFAHPGGEQRRGRRSLAEAGQGHVGRPGLAEGRVGRLVVVAVEGLRVGAQLVALAQQGAGLDEAQREPFGLEPEVARPVRLLVGERALHDAFQQLDRGAAAETGEEDLLDAGVGGGSGHVGGGPEQEGALGRRVEQLLERGAADLQVVEDDDRADAVDEGQEPFAVRPVQRSPVDGFEEPVQQVRGGPLVSREPYDAVGREVRAVVADGVQQGRAARARGARDPDRAAPRQQPYEPLTLLLALQEGQRRAGGPGGTGGAVARSRSVRSAAVCRTGAAGRAPGRQGSISLPSTGFTVSTKSPDISCTVRAWCPYSGVSGSRDWRRRPASSSERSYSSGSRLVGSIVKVPQTGSARLSLPASHAPLSFPVRCPPSGSVIGRRPNPKPSHSIYEPAGAAPPRTSRSREDCE